MMRFLRKLRGDKSCEEILEVLQAYLDGEVDETTARKVAGHLDECTQCDHESQVYVKIKSSLAFRKRPVDTEVLDALRRFGDDLVTDPAAE